MRSVTRSLRSPGALNILDTYITPRLIDAVWDAIATPISSTIFPFIIFVNEEEMLKIHKENTDEHS